MSFKKILASKKATNQQLGLNGHSVRIQAPSIHIYGSQAETTMSANELAEFFKLRKAVEAMTWEEVLWVHHNPTFHHSWDKGVPANLLPTDNRKWSVALADDEAAPSLWAQRKLVLHHTASVARLVKYGLAPMHADLQGSEKGRVEFDRLTNPDTGVAYAQEMGLTKTEFLVMVTIKALMDVRLVGSFRRFDELMASGDGLQQLAEQVGEVAFLHSRLERADTREEINLVGQMLVTTPKTIERAWVNTIFDFMGVDPNSARETMDGIVWGVSKRDTNPGFTLADVIPLADGSARKWWRMGKELAKRWFLVAQRATSRIFYDAIIEDFVGDHAKWHFDVHGPAIRVQKVSTLTIDGKSSGDGALATTVERFARVIGPAIGIAEDEARKMAKGSHYMHLNALTHLGSPKGHIHVIHDEADWEYPEADLVMDATSIDRDTRVHEDYSRIAAISLTPGTVKEDVARLWLNLRQIVPLLLEHMDEQQVEELPELLFDYLVTVFRGAIEGLWDPNDVEGEEEMDAWGEATMFNNFSIAEQAAATQRRQRRAAWYKKAAASGPFAAKTSGNKIFFSTLQKVEKAIEEWEKGNIAGVQQALCAIPVPARRLRTLVSAFAGKSAHVKPGDEVAFMVRLGKTAPHTVVISDRLLLDPVFQYLMEILDHDDGVIAMLFRNMSDNQLYLYLVKEPTSPKAGYFVPIREELGAQLDLPILRLKEAPFSVRTRQEIEAWIKRPKFSVSKLNRNPVDMKGRDHNALAYAWAVLDAKMNLGSLSVMAGLMTLLGRSNVRQDILFQASVIVDTMVNKDVSAKELQRAITKIVIDEVAAGTPFDTRYLHSEDSRYLNDYLVREFRKLREFEANDWIKDDVLMPVALGGEQYDHLYQQVLRLHEPLKYNAALVHALANGPIDSLLEEPTSQVAVDRAWWALGEAEQVISDVNLSSTQKEEALFRIAQEAERAVYRSGSYRPGDLAKSLSQLALARGCNRPYGRRLHNNVPAAIELVLSEFLHDVELEGYFSSELAIPTIPVQLKNAEELESGESYVLIHDGEFVRFARVEGDSFVMTEAFASTDEAKQWATILSNEEDTAIDAVSIIFAGVVPASRFDTPEDQPRLDTVGVFVIDEEVLPQLVVTQL